MHGIAYIYLCRTNSYEHTLLNLLYGNVGDWRMNIELVNDMLAVTIKNVNIQPTVKGQRPCMKELTWQVAVNY